MKKHSKQANSTPLLEKAELRQKGRSAPKIGAQIPSPTAQPEQEKKVPCCKVTFLDCRPIDGVLIKAKDEAGEVFTVIKINQASVDWERA